MLCYGRGRRNVYWRQLKTSEFAVVMVTHELKSILLLAFDVEVIINRIFVCVNISEWRLCALLLIYSVCELCGT